MARELPFGRAFLQVLRTRFGTDVYGHIQSILNAVVPVQILGHQDFSDEERPRWGISSYAQHLANPRYTTSSITAAVDIAIEEIVFEMRWTVGLIGNPVGNHPVILLTPPATWIPFDQGATAWLPGIKPDVRFGNSRTIVITGRNALPPPFYGAFYYQNLERKGGVAEEYATLTRVTFNPPFILPTPLYLTVSTVQTDIDLWVSWSYREIG